MALDAASVVSVSAIGDFDEIIDVRSPAEYAEDCIPQAINLPALQNNERAVVGKLYQDDPFAARKRGAGLLAANLARHLEGVLSSRPVSWRPLIYCWRGGQRSGAVVETLRRIGWPAAQLTGGYKAYRAAVLSGLKTLATKKHWFVIAGKTGVGKTLLLNNLKGVDTLDLENLANHRGSVFGGRGAQPSQRKFESTLYAALAKITNNDAPAFVESESRKIGLLHMPSALLTAMRQAPVIHIRADLQDRVSYIRAEYDDYIKDEKMFNDTVSQIAVYAGIKHTATWRDMHKQGRYDELVADLLVSFYDVGYEKSLIANYAAIDEKSSITINPNAADTLQQAAKEIAALSI